MTDVAERLRVGVAQAHPQWSLAPLLVEAAEEIARLTRERDEAVALLKELEWQYEVDDRWLCPVCGRRTSTMERKTIIGRVPHHVGCRLDALLGGRDE